MLLGSGFQINEHEAANMISTISYAASVPGAKAQLHTFTLLPVSKHEYVLRHDAV